MSEKIHTYLVVTTRVIYTKIISEKIVYEMRVIVHWYLCLKKCKLFKYFLSLCSVPQKSFFLRKSFTESCIKCYKYLSLPRSLGNLSICWISLKRNVPIEICSPLQNHSLKSCTLWYCRDGPMLNRPAGLTGPLSLVLCVHNCR